MVEPPGVVAIQEREKCTGRVRGAQIARRRTLRIVLIHVFHARPIGSDNRPGVVSGTIVDDDHFVWRIVLRQRAVDRPADKGGAIVCGNDHRECGAGQRAGHSIP